MSLLRSTLAKAFETRKQASPRPSGRIGTMRPEDYEDTPYRDPNDGLNNSNAMNPWTPSPTPGAIMRPEDYEDQPLPPMTPRGDVFRPGARRSNNFVDAGVPGSPVRARYDAETSLQQFRSGRRLGDHGAPRWTDGLSDLGTEVSRGFSRADVAWREEYRFYREQGYNPERAVIMADRARQRLRQP